VDRRTDIFAASVVLWEALTSERLFAADDEGGVVTKILLEPVPPPSSIVPELPGVLDDIVLKGLAGDPDARFATAHEMATALERALPVARPAEIGAYVEAVAGDVLAERACRIAEIEGIQSYAAKPSAPSPEAEGRARCA
jgi:eukaryotic-like serine/threonine-protein kinase